MYGLKEERKHFTMKEVAKLINIKDYGRTNLFKMLQEAGVLFSNNTTKQEYINKGYFKAVDNIVAPYGNFMGISKSCRVSESGIKFIKSLIDTPALFDELKKDALKMKNNSVI
jgi:phage antirepressor YoqD-like protein